MGNTFARPMNELEQLWPTGILQMKLDKQAAYADIVCIQNATDYAFCEDQIKSIRALFPLFPPNNTTGLANLAYMSKYAHPEFREEFSTVYLAYSSLLKRRFLTY
jgi:hypothetical protein